ncbi:MAG: diguanylate cyclase [Sphingomonas sp.]|uniref:diguanylate cyclase domain-containing protein n=1 Tax=Sphingomonas sp. TaxID=28214 RepID=UPI00260007A2|nr:diguanylate cyclase [Sphingomonas sp.]MBQ1498138.1 diguanylate cyclase [Sphingomonas sp.]
MAGPTQLPSVRQVLSRVHFRVTLVAVAIAGLTVMLTGFAALGIYARQNLELIAQTASYSVAPALVFDDPDAARLTIEPLAESPGVAGIVVFGPSAHPFAERAKATLAAGSSIGWVAKSLFFPRPVAAPVTQGGRVIGEVRVEGDASIVAGYIRAGLLGGLACLLVTAIATSLLARRLQEEIAAPLQAMAAVAHAVRVGRAFDRRAPSASIREIDSLRDDFNALLAELEEWHHRMRDENAALSHQATHDPLTGLPNRALLEQELSAALERARREGTSFALLYADGDGFKAINDAYGHAAGDAVLVAIGRRLRKGLRASDIAARLGGDEFAILLAVPSGAEAVARASEGIARQMAAPIALPGGEQVVVGLTLGAAVYPRDGEDLAALVHHADLAMLTAKQGRPQPRKEGRK